MPDFTGFTENQEKIEYILKEFFKKYDITLDKIDGRENNIAMNSLYTFVQTFRYMNNNATLKEKENDDTVMSDFWSTYNTTLNFALTKKQENVNRYANTTFYQEKKTDENFMSDFKTLFDGIFKLVYYPNLSKANKDKYDNQHQEFMDSNKDIESEMIKIKTSRAVDIILVRKNANTYTNKGLMTGLRDANYRYEQVFGNNNYEHLNNDVETVQKNTIDELLANYIALKEQYAKRNKIIRYFTGGESRREMAIAEETINRLIRDGKIVEAKLKDGKTDFLKTARNNVGSSNYLPHLRNSNKKVTYNDFYDKAVQSYENYLNKKKNDEIALEKRKRDNEKLNVFFNGLKNNGKIDFKEMDVENDYPIYKTAVKQYNDFIDNQMTSLHNEQKKNILKKLKEAFTESKASREVTEKYTMKNRTDELLNKLEEVVKNNKLDGEKYNLEKLKDKSKIEELKKSKKPTLTIEEINKEKLENDNKPQKMNLSDDMFKSNDANDLEIVVNGADIPDLASTK